MDGSSPPENDDLNHYLPLYKAAIKSEWETTTTFLQQNPHSLTAKLTSTSDTLLHVAIGAKNNSQYIKNLIDLLPTEALSQTNKFNETALHLAAKFGNVEAAKLLVMRNDKLAYVWSSSDLVAVHLGGLFGHKEMVVYLLSVMRDDVEPNVFKDEPGVKLINIVVDSGFFDVALDLLRRYPNLATTISSGGNTPLSILAGKPYAFASGIRLNILQRFIYSCIPVKLENFSHHPSGGGTESQSVSSMCFKVQIFRKNQSISICPKVFRVLWEVVEGLVPHIKHIHNTKLMHLQALQLLRCLCMEVIGVDNLRAAFIFKPPVLLGAELGIHEVVEEILRSFPSAIWSLNREQHDVFQLAVINRRESIFNLLYEMNEHRHMVTQISDVNENNILHLAGKLAPSHRLNLATGAALQMQRELQWYKEVEKCVQPNYREKENSSQKTPAMVFTEEHKDLVTEGEQWLKDTSKACTIAATLIATVVFAAAITVPGGNNEESGSTIFYKQKPFLIFSISNALSLFLSATSILMFLFILTAKCAEADFFYSLPNKLIVGLVTLFLSITTMMIAFSASIYLVFGDKNNWILVTVVALACLPVTLFVSLQFPLLVDMIRSTYCPGIFSRQGERRLY